MVLVTSVKFQCETLTLAFSWLLHEVFETLHDNDIYQAVHFVGYSAGLVIERLRVRIPAGAAGEFSSPELTLCADSYLVSAPPSRYRGGT